MSREWIIRLMSIAIGVCGIVLIGAAVYQYQIKYHDMSQFLAFVGIGLGCLVAGVTLTWLEQVFYELNKVRRIISYMDDKFAEVFRDNVSPKKGDKRMMKATIEREINLIDELAKLRGEK